MTTRRGFVAMSALAAACLVPLKVVFAQASQEQSRRQSIRRAALAFFLTTIAACPLAAAADEGQAPGAVEAIKTAVDAYIYGYPLMTFDMIRKQQTNVAAPDAEHAPMGQMIKMRTYPAVDNHCCAGPNADTLYTMVWLDVSSEPWVFSIPDMGDRYYIMPMLDGWSEVVEVPSSRTTGGKAQTYAITVKSHPNATPFSRPRMTPLTEPRPAARSPT